MSASDTITVALVFALSFGLVRALIRLHHVEKAFRVRMAPHRLTFEDLAKMKSESDTAQHQADDEAFTAWWESIKKTPPMAATVWHAACKYARGSSQ